MQAYKHSVTANLNAITVIYIYMKKATLFVLMLRAVGNSFDAYILHAAHYSILVVSHCMQLIIVYW